MPVLPSFINYGKGKRKFKVPTKYPFITYRPNLQALCPPPSSEVVDINDSSTSQLEEEEFVSKGSLDSAIDEYHYEPLDVNISPEPLMSSFPSRFLKNSYIQPPNTIPPRIGSDGEENGGMQLGSTSAENNDFDTEDEDPEELIARLQGMDASSFVASPSGSPPFAPFNYNAPSSRRRSINKALLAPIQITTTGERDSSQPHSQRSSPASSAVSGTTLARALISNTFVLSIDTRDSRKYRSGVSTLTRTDSATLPMGDYPFLPWNSGVDVPPVPQMPSEAELLILASKATSPHSGLNRRKTGGFRKHSSTGSLDLPRSPELSGPVASSEIPITAVIDSVSASSVQASRRISRITEGTTSVPETIIFRDFDTADENKAEMVLPDSPMSPTGNIDNATAEVRKLPPVPGSTSTLPTRTGEEAEASARAVDNVIDYYSGFSPEAPHTGFKPAFSPITEVSETSGISPLISPFRRPYFERSSFSPLSPEYGVLPNDSQSQSGSDPHHHTRLPVRDTPRPSASTGIKSKRYRYSASFSNIPTTSVRQTYTRKRSGSAPSPIVVVQDPYDFNKYRVTMSPESHGVPSPPMGDSAIQTFPETPYSPIWSPLGAASTSIAGRLQDDRAAQFPRTPESGSLSFFDNMQTTQAVLMTRAGSGARHSRQSSVTRIRERKESISQESEEKNDAKTDDANTSSTQSADPDVSLSGPRKYPAAAGSSSFSIRSYTGSTDGHASRPSSRDATSKRSSVEGSMNTVNSNIGEQQNHRQEPSSITDGEETSSSGNFYLNNSRKASQESPVETQNSPRYTATARPSLTLNSSVHSLSPLRNSTESFLTHAEQATESPPAYDTVFGDRLASDSRTPSTAGFDFPSYRPPQNAGESQSRDSLILNQRQRQRPRPRLPAGPRDRRDGRTASQTGRDRNGSVSSVASALPSGIPRAPAPSVQSPHFNVPSPKFKGLTMEAAKWTFTSAELQAIVSRAIQQSAEALSIRLLHLDTLDNDIPEDLARLESERRDIQLKYRSLVHRRNKLLDSLSNSSGPQTAESTSRIVEALKEVSGQLDKLTEDLHSVDEQLSRLNTLVLKHSSSALAMALRKLNKSFLEKLSELERVRHEMVQLEAERNDAVKQAEEAALKTDNNSSSVSQRRTSVRRFKAGFYSQSRPASYHSNRASISSVLTANLKSPGQEDVPPVPPLPSNPTIPRRRIPDQIHVDAPMRSANPLSAATFSAATPDTRALLEQEELYFDIERHIGTQLRRSRSFGALLSNTDSSRRPRSPLRANGLVQGSRRPASLPGDSRLSDAYRAMNADSNAMLLTLRMLSDAV